MKRFLPILTLLLLSAHGSTAAQDLDPRRYVNLPINQNFFRVAYGYSKGDVNVTPTIPIENASLSIHGTSLAFNRSFALAGKLGTVDAWLPYFCSSGEGEVSGTFESRSTCGSGDATARFTYNFIGAPALAMNDFISWQRRIVVGASVQVSMPTGHYNSNYVVNSGANRWVLKPEIGISVPWKKWSFEFSAGVRFFSDNDEYILGSTLEQDPLTNLQLHVIHDFSQRQWLSLNVNYFFGGETYRDGAPAAIKQENSRIGVTWSIALNSRQILKIVASTGVITRVGNNSNTASLEWIYRWE